jgi:autotransporter-associated beta strand protein
MKTLFRTIASAAWIALLSISATGQVVVMQPLTTFGPNGDGSLRPGDVVCLTSAGQLQRGMAYNPTTGHLLVVDRATNSSINYFVYILDGASGVNLGTLATISPLAGGNAAFPLNLIGVADDGAIYAANLSNATGGSPQVRLYRWADESDPSPALVSPTPSFPNDDPSGGATDTSQKRWGDTMTVRGSGLNTQILLANRGTLAALYTPDDGTYSHFTPKTLTTDVATGALGYGLTFGGGDTFWGTSGANGNGPLLHLSFDAGAATGTTLTNFPPTNFPGTISPILVMGASNLLAGITMVAGPDVVRLYDISNTNSPVLLDRKSFITATNNAAFGGALALGTNGVLYALDSDNGIMAFTLATAGSNPLPPAFFLNPANITAQPNTNVTFTSAADSTLPISYQWFYNTNFAIAGATNASLSLTNIQIINSGNYHAVATNHSTGNSATSSIAVLNVSSASSGAETWNLALGGTWDSLANWNPAGVPNGVGASAVFNSAASANNPAQTGNRTITADGGQTVGSIVFNNDAANAFTTSITTGAGGSLTFDETGAGPATITVPAVAGTGNNTISAAITLADSLVATVSNITASSAAGALNLTATISGPGGFTKLGDGLATFGTGAKTYTGSTVIGGGRIRISVAAQPSTTSSFTISAGGQVTQITAGSITFGSGTLYLNGAGPATGPFAPFPGAIRNDTGLISTINSAAVVLQSDTLIHVQGTAGSTTIANSVSGPGKLTFTATPHDANLGTLVLNGANTYGGGTVVDGGTLDVNAASATLGTGDVTVHSANLVFGGASAKLKIEPGVLNAIADTATLSLDGGKTAGIADDGYVDLGAGINEIVGGLKLGGVTQSAGIYGSTSSGATFQNDEYFSGSGIVTVVAAPTPPLLTITLSSPDVIISWPTNAVGYQLQAVGALTETWSNDNTTIVVSGTNNTVTETIGTNKFYRLKK